MHAGELYFDHDAYRKAWAAAKKTGKYPHEHIPRENQHFKYMVSENCPIKLAFILSCKEKGISAVLVDVKDRLIASGANEPRSLVLSKNGLKNRRRSAWHSPCIAWSHKHTPTPNPSSTS
jgi:hypothetical protein